MAASERNELLTSSAKRASAPRMLALDSAVRVPVTRISTVCSGPSPSASPSASGLSLQRTAVSRAVSRSKSTDIASNATVCFGFALPSVASTSRSTLMANSCRASPSASVPSTYSSSAAALLPDGDGSQRMYWLAWILPSRESNRRESVCLTSGCLRIAAISPSGNPSL